MKILYDCFSCSPYYGSDEGIGWLWPYYMRNHHEVWALVRKDRKADIDRYCRENHISGIHFIYADVPDWMNFYYKNKAKGKNGTLDFLAYQFLWQFAAYLAARKIHKKEKFDLVHHVGTNDFRFLGLLAHLKIPYIIGPIGGAQEVPGALVSYVQAHKKTEKLRSILNRVLTSSLEYRYSLNHAWKVYVSNEETRQYVARKMKNPSRCEILTEVGVGDCDVCKQKKDSLEFQGMTFLWAGRMEYRKGLEFLFDVLDRLPLEMVWQLILCGDGSEKERYMQLVREKKYSDRVIFKGKIPYEELQNLYEQSDVFVFPSLRETTGTVIVEAMAHGVPVIAIDQGGARYVLQQNAGMLISGRSKEDMIDNFANAMLACMQNKKKTETMGRNAQLRISSYYLWNKKIEYMLEQYKEMLR